MLPEIGFDSGFCVSVIPPYAPGWSSAPWQRVGLAHDGQTPGVPGTQPNRALHKVLASEGKRREKCALREWSWDKPYFDDPRHQRQLRLFNSLANALTAQRRKIRQQIIDLATQRRTAMDIRDMVVALSVRPDLALNESPVGPQWGAMESFA